MISEQREAIKSLLEAGYTALSKNPYITIKGFPASAEALESLQKEFKAYDNCAIAITFTSERPGARKAAIYPQMIDVYTIFIFSNSKESDEEIIEHFEIARNILNTRFYLYFGEMSPVKSEKTGLWMAAYQIGTQNIYQGA